VCYAMNEVAEEMNGPTGVTVAEDGSGTSNTLMTPVSVSQQDLKSLRVSMAKKVTVELNEV